MGGISTLLRNRQFLRPISAEAIELEIAIETIPLKLKLDIFLEVQCVGHGHIGWR